jgi:hypothetical protein
MAGTTDRTIDSIPGMKIDKTIDLWRRALDVLDDPKQSAKHKDAERILQAIDVEWDRRRRNPNPDDMFPWPSTEAFGGSGNLDADGWQEEGILKLMGYTVGDTRGQPFEVRKRILSRVFSGSLPPAFEAQYLDEWDRPSTPARLKKMAQTIAALTRNAKRKGSSMRSAIRDWDRDLEFLYREYYIGKFHFDWPDSAV